MGCRRPDASPLQLPTKNAALVARSAALRGALTRDLQGWHAPLATTGRMVGLALKVYAHRRWLAGGLALLLGVRQRRRALRGESAMPDTGSARRPAELRRLRRAWTLWTWTVRLTPLVATGVSIWRKLGQPARPAR